MQAKSRLIVFFTVSFFFLFFLLRQISYSQNQSVSVTVPAKASDFQTAISTDTLTAVPQGTEITYQITYGSHLYYATGIVIEATWTQGTVEGSPTPSVDVADYIIGSAEKAYDNTSAVVDLVNRKITWTINSFPGRTTDQTVSFKLKTTENYTGINNVSFDVSTKLINDSLTVPDQTVSNKYLFDETLVTPTPTPTSTPTPTPTTVPSTGTSTQTTQPTSTPTPTPTTIPQAPVIENVTIQSLSDNQATLRIKTDTTSTLKISYGTDLNLKNTITTLTPATLNEIDISKLEPDTTYYIQILSKGKDGLSTKSDIFTFNTPPISTAPEIDENTLIVTSNNNILTSPLSRDLDVSRPTPVIIVPQETSYEFLFRLNKGENVKEIKAILRNKLILGINNFTQIAEASTDTGNMMEIEPGVYTGRLKAPLKTGLYEIIVRIVDVKGNIVEKKITDVKVVKPFTILGLEDDNRPIEAARVILELYNPRTRSFSVISPQVLPVKNPQYSMPNGQLDLTLPSGKYRAKITALGYTDKTVIFELGASQDQTYPQVYLEKAPFSVINYIKYYSNASFDFTNITLTYVRDVSLSFRFSQTVNLLVIVISLILSLILLSIRTHIPIKSLHWYFTARIITLFSKDYINKYIRGTVVDQDSGLPIGKALVCLIDAEKNKILHKVNTDRFGEFYFKKMSVKKYKILINKKGFEEAPMFEYSKDALDQPQQLRLALKPYTSDFTSFKKWLEWALEKSTTFLFSVILSVSIFSEVIMGFSFGWLETAPFLVLSVINLIFWGIFFGNSTSKNS